MRTLSVIVDSHAKAMELVEAAYASGELARMIVGLSRTMAKQQDVEDMVGELWVDLATHPYDPSRQCTVSTWVGMWAGKRREYARRDAVKPDSLEKGIGSGEHEDRDGASFTQGFDRLLSDWGGAAYRENSARYMQCREIRRIVRKEFGFAGLMVLRSMRRGHGAGRELIDTLSRMGITRIGKVNVTPVWVSQMQGKIRDALSAAV